jgi:hypothetical protein
VVDDPTRVIASSGCSVVTTRLGEARPMSRRPPTPRAAVRHAADAKYRLVIEAVVHRRCAEG